MELRDRLQNLIRGRYLICVLGMIIVLCRPDVSSEIVYLAALACGVSALDSLAPVVSAFKARELKPKLGRVKK